MKSHGIQCLLNISKKATDLMEISSADTFPHYIPVGPNTGEVFIAKIWRRKKNARTWRDSFSVTPWSLSAEHEPPAPKIKVLQTSDIVISIISIIISIIKIIINCLNTFLIALMWMKWSAVHWAEYLKEGDLTNYPTVVTWCVQI